MELSDIIVLGRISEVLCGSEHCECGDLYVYNSPVYTNNPYQGTWNYHQITWENQFTFGKIYLE